jgi:hypothetical protein
MAVDCTLVDAFGGALTVGRGGFGDDNVVGDLTDGGTAVGNATIVASNVATSDNGQDTTNTSGAYNFDINLAAGQTVRIVATWTDAAGRTRRISGTCTVT